jgi:hypothetical protein
MRRCIISYDLNAFRPHSDGNSWICPMAQGPQNRLLTLLCPFLDGMSDQLQNRFITFAPFYGAAPWLLANAFHSRRTAWHAWAAFGAQLGEGRCSPGRVLRRAVATVLLVSAVRRIVGRVEQLPRGLGLPRTCGRPTPGGVPPSCCNMPSLLRATELYNDEFLSAFLVALSGLVFLLERGKPLRRRLYLATLTGLLVLPYYAGFESVAFTRGVFSPAPQFPWAVEAPVSFTVDHFGDRIFLPGVEQVEQPHVPFSAAVFAVLMNAAELATLATTVVAVAELTPSTPTIFSRVGAPRRPRPPHVRPPSPTRSRCQSRLAPTSLA